MTTLSGKFEQSPVARRRYILNYQLTLSSGETVVSVGTPTVTQIFGKITVAPFAISSVVISSDGTEVLFYASGGDDGTQYEVLFLATTSAAQILDDVVEFDIDSDL